VHIKSLHISIIIINQKLVRSASIMLRLITTSAYIFIIRVYNRQLTLALSD